MPPPTTTRSAETSSPGMAAFSKSASFSAGGIPLSKINPAKRASNPEISQMASVTSGVSISISPPFSQLHSRLLQPKVFESFFPLTLTRNAHGQPSSFAVSTFTSAGNQFLALTQIRQRPVLGKVTFALASGTRRPKPCANKYAEPTDSENCASTLQPLGLNISGETATRFVVAESWSDRIKLTAKNNNLLSFIV